MSRYPFSDDDLDERFDVEGSRRVRFDDDDDGDRGRWYRIHTDRGQSPVRSRRHAPPPRVIGPVRYVTSPRARRRSRSRSRSLSRSLSRSRSRERVSYGGAPPSPPPPPRRAVSGGYSSSDDDGDESQRDGNRTYPRSSPRGQGAARDYSSRKLHQSNRYDTGSDAHSSTTSAYSSDSESKYPKKGKTRIPSHMVAKRALVDLEYPFTTEVRQIQEVLRSGY